MKRTEGLVDMQITVTVSDELVREAGARGVSVLDFIETLIDNGMSAVKERPVLNSAMDRIRALRSMAIGETMERKR
jgi:hypothetical protein